MDDPELRLDQPPTDLHSLRRVDPDLDELCVSIQRRAVSRIVARLTNDARIVARLRGKRILVTGSAGYLGATVYGALQNLGVDTVGLDVVVTGGDKNNVQGNVEDGRKVRGAMSGCDGVIHCAALHAPHATHYSEAAFSSTNVKGTQNIIETAAAEAGKNNSFLGLVHTSTTSLTVTKRVKALEDTGSIVWLDESAQPPLNSSDILIKNPLDVPRNKYGRTKLEGERRCIAAAKAGLLPVCVIRISRVFPEEEIPTAKCVSSHSISSPNMKLNELLGRRVSLEDAVEGLIRALSRCREPAVCGSVLMLCAPWPWPRDETPLTSNEMLDFLRQQRPEVVRIYAGLEWKLPLVTRVYDCSKTMQVLEWRPAVTFDTLLASLATGSELSSDAIRGRY